MGEGEADFERVRKGRWLVTADVADCRLESGSTGRGFRRTWF
jgi:hypothetical protein